MVCSSRGSSTPTGDQRAEDLRLAQAVGRVLGDCVGADRQHRSRGHPESDLNAIWHLHSHPAMPLLSLAVLTIRAIGATLVAIRAFRRATLS